MQSEIFALSSQLVDDYLRLSPVRATYAGVSGHDHRWDDFSQEGMEETAAVLARYRDLLAGVPSPSGRWDTLAYRIATAFVDERLEAIAFDEPLYDLNTIASAVQDIRQVFDVMSRESVADWENIVERLATIDGALGSYRRALEAGVSKGLTASRRQAAALVEESRGHAGERSSFRALPAELKASGRATPQLAARLETAVGGACLAFGDFADFLEEEYLPCATRRDGVGEERYERKVRRFLGMDLEPLETYRWGWDLVAEVKQRMVAAARRVDPSRTLAEVVELVKTDPGRCAGSPEEFVAMMAERQSMALRQLAGKHFDIPREVERIHVRIAPPGGALGAYYVPASEGFRRPGTVWYSIGSHTVLPLWDEVSTAYHEGFPGHHLQSGFQLSLADRLSRLHRLLVSYPGYGEGWALYAETLMDELGYLEKPDYELGMLSSSMLRACRVVIDIGSHLGYPIPTDAIFHPGEEWSFSLASEMLQELAFLNADYAVSEVNRYLGWPGQAIAYKVGERVILELRQQLMHRRGPSFELKEFHTRVLGSGPVGLDHLRDLVLGDEPDHPQASASAG